MATAFLVPFRAGLKGKSSLQPTDGTQQKTDNTRNTEAAKAEAAAKYENQSRKNARTSAEGKPARHANLKGPASCPKQVQDLTRSQSTGPTTKP